jgi:hypothetical protein
MKRYLLLLTCALCAAVLFAADRGKAFSGSSTCADAHVLLPSS